MGRVYKTWGIQRVFRVTYKMYILDGWIAVQHGNKSAN